MQNVVAYLPDGSTVTVILGTGGALPNPTSTYSDVNPNFGTDQNPLVLTDEDAINAELENCLGIAPGEVWFEPTFGSDLRTYLFDPVDDITSSLIWMEVLDRIPLWMPNITLLKGTGVYCDYDDQTYTVQINYSVNGTSVTGTFSGTMAGNLANSSISQPS